MRWLIKYFRSCFCKHDWELIFDTDVEYHHSSGTDKYKEKVYRCKKCGYAEHYKNC